MNGIPSVMAGFWGSHLGQIDLMIQRTGGDYKIIGHSTVALPIFKREAGKIVSLVEPSKPVISEVSVEHDATLEYVRRPVGKTAKAMDTFFALVADNAALQVISDAQLWYAKKLLAEPL